MALKPLASAATALALALGFAVLPAGAAPSAAPAAPACPPQPARIRVTVAVTDPEPVLSTTLGIDALHARTGRPRSATVHHLALTTSRVEWHGEIEASSAAGRGGVCAMPDRVALRLVQAEHLVRIAHEIPRGTCLFREVEAHERRHVAVNRRTLRAAAARARRAAEAWAASARGRGATEREAMAALQRGLRQAIEPALAGMRAAREAAHRGIDAPAEYRRLARICPADQRALRERLRAAATD